MIWRLARGDAQALLREVVRSAWGLEELPEVERGEGGKPFFPGFPHCQFNLSHSGDLALCAASDRPVGADVEVLRPRREGLPGYVLDERELRWFRSRGQTWGDFYALWTLKEARVKCTGEGLRRPPREIAVPCLEAGETAEEAGFLFTALGGEDWRGAVCEKMT